MSVVRSPIRGRVLGSASISADATRNAATFADVTGLTTTVPVVGPVLVIFSCASASNNVATNGVSIRILEDATSIGGASHLLGASQGVPIHRTFLRNPSAGSHTYKVQLRTLFGGTATISADAADVGPATLFVLEA
jgi:hypothetical protein